MADRDFRRLPQDLQIAIWEEASERIFNLIRDALGTTYRHLIKRCAPGDGIGCYRAMLLLENVQTAGARNRFLSQLMALKLQHTGDAKNAASMLTYYNKLIEINEKYSKANDGEGVGNHILRAKLMELPEQYKWPAHCLEQDDVESKRLNRPARTCQEIVDYVGHWEANQKQKSGGGSRPHHMNRRRAVRFAPKASGRGRMKGR